MSTILTEGLVLSDATDTRDDSFIELIGRYIDFHFTKPLSTADISAALGYNRNYFCTLFKKNFGTTFIKYLNEYRVTRAADDYSGSSLSLPDIAPLPLISGSKYPPAKPGAFHRRAKPYSTSYA